jgi:hypothetical protein
LYLLAEEVVVVLDHHLHLMVVAAVVLVDIDPQYQERALGVVEV